MDSFLGIGLPELIFIAVLALIFLGPERLPETLRQIAKAWGYVRNLGRELTAQFSEEFKDLEDLNPRKLLNDLADEELAKDLKSLNANTNKRTAATKAVATTTKPGASTAAKTATAAKSGAPAAATKVTKPATAVKTSEQQSPARNTEKSVAPPVSETAATADTTAGGEQTILLAAAQPHATAPPTNGAKATEVADAG
jgi:sec-independent protein translocase protein TatB